MHWLNSTIQIVGFVLGTVWCDVICDRYLFRVVRTCKEGSLAESDNLDCQNVDVTSYIKNDLWLVLVFSLSLDGVKCCGVF